MKFLYNLDWRRAFLEGLRMQKRPRERLICLHKNKHLCTEKKKNRKKEEERKSRKALLKPERQTTPWKKYSYY